MCYIYYKNNDTLFDVKTLQSRWQWNNDSTGILYRKNITEKWQIIKLFSKETNNWNYISALIDEIQKNNQEVIVHFRFATSGEICDKYTHPAIFNSKYFIHNGVMRELTYGKHSDTYNFAKNYDWLVKDKMFMMNLLQGNKMLVSENYKDTIIYNSKLGHFNELKHWESTSKIDYTFGYCGKQQSWGFWQDEIKKTAKKLSLDNKKESWEDWNE